MARVTFTPTPQGAVPTKRYVSVFGRNSRERTYGAKAVVTGAGSGIGREFALELARRGGTVVCSDLHADRVAETAEMVEKLGTGSAVAHTGDVAKEDDIANLADTARSHFDGPTSLMINNAGVGIGGKRVGEIGLEDWRWALDINLWGMVVGSELFMPQLREVGRPAGLINVASAAGFTAAPTMAPYNVGKAGVMALAETLAAELAGTKINTTVLCPTFVPTRVISDGRVAEGKGRSTAEKAMSMSRVDAAGVAKMTLDANERGKLYVVPQLEAKAFWFSKRMSPRIYVASTGLVNRYLGDKP